VLTDILEAEVEKEVGIQILILISRPISRLPTSALSISSPLMDSNDSVALARILHQESPNVEDNALGCYAGGRNSSGQ
jgi:hypothetical protein